jgi:uncharacterized protein (TIGR00730 family)
MSNAEQFLESSHINESTEKKERDLKSVVVYCASSNQVRSIFFEHARSLGQILANHKISIRYGGGNSGLMGEIAKSSRENGGEVIGIIPKFMIDNNWNMEIEFLTEMIVTQTMHERKTKMLDGVDAAIALAGGVGTLEELLEVICWKKLGLFTKPIIILNTDGYYNDLLRMFDKTVEENFMVPDCSKLWTVVSTPDEIIKAMIETPDTVPGSTFVHELVAAN